MDDIKTTEPQYFCAGLFVEENLKSKFVLMRCSGSDVPYIVRDQNNHALRLAGSTASLYAVDLPKNRLIRIDDKHYGLSGHPMPKTVKLTAEMREEIQRAIRTGQFLDKK